MSANYLFSTCKVKHTIAVLLLMALTKRLICNAVLLKCPIYQMHLQKIVGFRPPLNYMTGHNLIYTPASNFKDRNRNEREQPVLRVQANTIRPSSQICWTLCNEDDNCIAYVHLLDIDECYGYTHIERSERYLSVGSEMPLVADAEALFYEKTCLNVPFDCRNRLWALTKIPGNSLVFQGKKTIATLVTRRECAEKCLFEREFKCLSASFAPSYRNNHERLNDFVSIKEHITLGRCILSDKDKMIQPDAFRAAPYDEEYMENQCHERAIESDHCSYELYANSSFSYAELKYMGLTQKECQARCSNETTFYCQGVSFYYKNDLSKSECRLHSEDIISLGPRSLKLKDNSVYMRRVKCLDVQVLCTQNELIVKYQPKDWFRGKMYVSQHSKDCMVPGNGTSSTFLRLPIGSESKENRCNILRAYEVTKDYSRIFISTLVVIQNNANVQTQGDRLIKVGCIMSNSTKLTTESNNNGLEDDNDEEDGTDDDYGLQNEPSAIALESSLHFTHDTAPSEGSLLLNSSDNFALLPQTRLQIIDLAHQHQTDDVQIGQSLELQIIAEYTPQQQQQQGIYSELPPLPDFRATSLIARTQNNQNYVQLIDERGCPTDVTVFPALERLRTSTQNILRARFHAFKFAGSSLVNFDVKIHFCASHCGKENCLQLGAAHDRWRRQLLQQVGDQSFRVQNPIYISTVMDVHNQTMQARNITELGLPLNTNLRVRGPEEPNSNSYIYGERGILLIAGIDDQLHLDNICLNQSLLIALFIFWLIFQIALLFGCCFLAQKYRRLCALEAERKKLQESLEYYESRRVHFADQGGYTL